LSCILNPTGERLGYSSGAVGFKALRVHRQAANRSISRRRYSVVSTNSAEQHEARLVFHDQQFIQPFDSEVSSLAKGITLFEITEQIRLLRGCN
jgi:hypothetical protein